MRLPFLLCQPKEIAQLDKFPVFSRLSPPSFLTNRHPRSLLTTVSSRRQFLHAAGLALAGLGFSSPALLAAEEKIHVVRRGESLSVISRRYNTTIAALKQRNSLKSDTILVGQELRIPAVSPAPSPAPAASGTQLAAVIQKTRALNIQRGRWKYIVVHHSAIERGNATVYHRTHLQRGMENGLAYHFVIGNGIDSGDGEIEIGPRWLKQLNGGHVRNATYNQQGIGICLVGNLQNHPPTPKQWAALTALIDWLRTSAPLGVKPSVTVHRWVDRNHTACPGSKFPYSTLKQRYPA